MNSYNEILQRVIDIGEEIDPLLSILTATAKLKIELLQHERKILSYVLDGIILKGKK